MNINNDLEKESKYLINKELNKDIDKVLNDITERNPVKLRDCTPVILVNNGIKDLPMYENPSHIRKNILTNEEAKMLGLKINYRDHYHGLGKDLYIKAIYALDKPRAIFKYNNSRDYLILTIVKDANGSNIVVPIEIETETIVKNIRIDINRVKSVYGYKSINNIDLNKYIKNNIRNRKFKKIYEQEKRTRYGL